jgi:hypothetical protein
MKFEPSQIIPAVGWAAVFDEGGEDNFVPIICWALGKGSAKTVRVIHGMIATEDGEIVPAKSFSTFLRYEITSDNYDIGHEFELDVN